MTPSGVSNGGCWERALRTRESMPVGAAGPTESPTLRATITSAAAWKDTRTRNGEIGQVLAGTEASECSQPVSSPAR